MVQTDEWLASVTAPLPAEKIRCQMADEHPDWAFIDSEIIKLGSLGHSSLDIAGIEQRIHRLLAQESKDFRLVVHLLRVMQHSGEPEKSVAAVQVLCSWVHLYWSQAWPDNLVMKRRLAQQILKRFSMAAGRFTAQASDDQRQAILGELAHLAQLWQSEEKTLAAEVDILGELCRRIPAPVTPAGDSAGVSHVKHQKAERAAPVVGAMAQASLPVIDPGDEKVWRDTQLQLADALCQHQSDNPLGYRLRRNAVWHGIASAPSAQADGRTVLAAFSADRMMDYRAKASTPNVALWQQVEYSLTLAPYWFEGHQLSADIARSLGYSRVADAIREELACFLQRLPQLATLSFSDRTPFLSAGIQNWLDNTEIKQQRADITTQAGVDINEAMLHQCYQQQGLQAALSALDGIARQQSPRRKFYCQLLEAELLYSAGLEALARQHYQHLYQCAQGIILADWEPELIRQLKNNLDNSKG